MFPFQKWTKVSTFRVVSPIRVKPVSPKVIITAPFEGELRVSQTETEAAGFNRIEYHGAIQVSNYSNIGLNNKQKKICKS